MEEQLIINAIRAATRNCVRFGGQPNELWLGPKEYGNLRAYVTQLFSIDTRDDGNPTGDEFFDGMLIKHMTESGWRVGRTFTP